MELLEVGGGGTIRCQLGNHEVKRIAVLSIEGQPPMGCIPCWRERGFWCDRHDQGHQGFTDGTSACLACVEEMVDRREGRVLVLREIMATFPKDEITELEEWLATVTEITGQSRERCFTRAIATLALRTKTPFSWVAQKIRTDRSVASILPNPF